MTNRRHFLLRQLPALAASCALELDALAADVVAPVAESDPQARQLHYRANVDRLKAGDLPGFEAGQRCENCGLFNRIKGTPFGQCEALAQRAVAENGWCTAFVPAM
jgi:hypothetical protein